MPKNNANRVTILAAAEKDMQDTLTNLAERIAKQLQDAGIKTFTLADGKSLMDHWRTVDVDAKPATLRKRLQRFRAFLEGIGVKVIKDARGGARKGKDADKDDKDAKGSGRPEGSAAPKGPDVSKPACQRRIDDLMAAIAAKGGPGSKEARTHLREIASFLGLDI